MNRFDSQDPEDSVQLMGQGRRLTGSQRGLPVLVPGDTEDGDLVCVLWHCPVPVILRQVEDHYVLVGECCIRGYMDDYMPSRNMDHKDTDRSESDHESVHDLESNQESMNQYESSARTTIYPRRAELCWEKLARGDRPATCFDIR